MSLQVESFIKKKT